MPDNPELDRHWAGDPGTLRQFQRERNDRLRNSRRIARSAAVQRGGTHVIEARPRRCAVDGKGHQVLPVVSDMPPDR